MGAVGLVGRRAAAGIDLLDAGRRLGFAATLDEDVALSNTSVKRFS